MKTINFNIQILFYFLIIQITLLQINKVGTFREENTIQLSYKNYTFSFESNDIFKTHNNFKCNFQKDNKQPALD